MQVIKMQACGNDFCFVKYNDKLDYAEIAKKLCNRRLGVGADGLLVFKDTADYELICYNADGTRASMCGNGLICLANYASKHDLLRRGHLTVLTNDGPKNLEVLSMEPFLCKLSIGLPVFSNQMLYISDPIDSFGRLLKLHDKTITIYSLYLGTINTIVFVDDFTEENLCYAEEIANHKLFNRQTNVNFVKLISKNEIAVRVYEKGVGFTLASGTGAASAALVTSKIGYTQKELKVDFELGSYQVKIMKKEIFLIGTAQNVFQLELEEEEYND